MENIIIEWLTRHIIIFFYLLFLSFCYGGNIQEYLDIKILECGANMLKQHAKTVQSEKDTLTLFTERDPLELFVIDSSNVRRTRLEQKLR